MVRPPSPPPWFLEHVIEDQFAHAVGRLLVAWAKLDYRMREGLGVSVAYSDALSPSEPKYEIPQIRYGRAGFILAEWRRQTLRHFKSDAEKLEIEQIVSSYDEVSKIRHTIAHGYRDTMPPNKTSNEHLMICVLEENSKLPKNVANADHFKEEMTERYIFYKLQQLHDCTYRVIDLENRIIMANVRLLQKAANASTGEPPKNC